MRILRRSVHALARAGDAHGWLAQVWGEKLFVLFPPRDSALLGRIPEEARARACCAAFAGLH